LPSPPASESQSPDITSQTGSRPAHPSPGGSGYPIRISLPGGGGSGTLQGKFRCSPTESGSRPPARAPVFPPESGCDPPARCQVPSPRRPLSLMDKALVSGTSDPGSIPDGGTSPHPADPGTFGPRIADHSE